MVYDRQRTAIAHVAHPNARYLARPAIFLRLAAGSALVQHHQRIPISRGRCNRASLARDRASPLELVSGLIIAVAASVGLVVVIRHRPRVRRGISRRETGAGQTNRSSGRTFRLQTFADVGGMDAQKRRISAVVKNRLLPREIRATRSDSKRNSAVWPTRNRQDIPGGGYGGRVPDQLLSRPTDSLVSGQIGSSEANIRAAFSAGLSISACFDSSSTNWIPSVPNASNWARTVMSAAAPGVQRHRHGTDAMRGPVSFGAGLRLHGGHELLRWPR